MAYVYCYLEEKAEYMGMGVSEPYVTFACPKCANEGKADKQNPFTIKELEQYFADCGEKPVCDYCLKEIGIVAWMRYWKRKQGEKTESPLFTDPDDLAKIRVREAEDEEAYYSRYGDE